MPLADLPSIRRLGYGRSEGRGGHSQPETSGVFHLSSQAGSHHSHRPGEVQSAVLACVSKVFFGSGVYLP